MGAPEPVPVYLCSAKSFPGMGFEDCRIKLNLASSELPPRLPCQLGGIVPTATLAILPLQPCPRGRTEAEGVPAGGEQQAKALWWFCPPSSAGPAPPLAMLSASCSLQLYLDLSALIARRRAQKFRTGERDL